ncbi:MAG TPA: MotA/TolQ/ExbB proton channel family protein [Planctomycetota bacterium]|nr:MotA/TolQ/ExbB proton channel family protein [Planctomycetota bacterium]HRR83159.1 MotA/TolQ/ExbB proton channel family protein [Planctomycetota bacterium]HRT97023.1 MotA/TolQ/ExbB proton channel family protein [Planctomycetota bacterium]
MLQLLVDGGPLMVPLVLCSVFTVAVLLDRGYAFYRHGKLDTRALRAKVLGLVEEDRVDEAAALCANTPSPVAAVLLAGLQSYARHRPLASRVESLLALMEKAMSDCTQHAMTAVEKRFAVLTTVGSAAPLFGMTGTVTGMIGSFGALSAAGVEASGVASGIAEALITTAAGLLIALAAVIPYNILVAMSGRIELEMDEATSELLDLIAIRAGVRQ